MRYRQLGRTGLSVSEIGFGCGSQTGLMVRGERVEQLNAVARAIELGINYFDTAPSYGDGRSETNLSAVLRELKANVQVGTKIELGDADLNDLPSAVLRSAVCSGWAEITSISSSSTPTSPSSGSRGRAC